MRLYVGGPMTDLPEENHPAFAYASKRLFDASFTPISPHVMEQNLKPEDRIGLSKGDNYKRVIPSDIVALATCDGMILLPGWEQSNGTALERCASELFEMPVFAPAYTSDEFPGGLAEWMDVIIDMIREYANREWEPYSAM